jgi:hypothetical protein
MGLIEMRIRKIRAKEDIRISAGRLKPKRMALMFPIDELVLTA